MKRVPCTLNPAHVLLKVIDNAKQQLNTFSVQSLPAGRVKRTMKIGLIGLGFMGGVHLAAIERTGNATVTAVSTRTRPVADGPPRGNLHHIKTAALPDHVRWEPDWRQLLLDPEIDAVDLCLPTHLHKEVVLSALKAGKHVLCEKPMALTAADCDAMLKAASDSDRCFMVAQVLRFMSPYRYAASFVRTAPRDSLKSCTLSRKTGYPKWSEWLSKEEQSGGAILDLLSHDIDQALSWFGQPVSVRAVSQGEIDTMRGTLHYADGFEVKIEGGWFAPEVPFSAGFEIAGQESTLSFQEGKLQQLLPSGSQPVTLPENDEYLDEVAYFIECCEKNRAPELCPPSESAQAVRVANLLKASREQNGKDVPCKI
ncbi:MAG: putative dehydrogenase [Acidobacteriaceae bacterium]|nr:putative dehydrogenase [Acidobacteriaceae bacterium]